MFVNDDEDYIAPTTGAFAASDAPADASPSSAPQPPALPAASASMSSQPVQPLPQYAPSSQAPVYFIQAPAPPAPQAEPNPDVTERAHMLGFGLIASSLGAVAGLRIGGVYGGVAGTLFAGSAVNLYRAAIHGSRRTPEGDREAAISATYGLIAAGLGGYISYKTSEWRRQEPAERTYAPPLIANVKKGLKGLY